MVLFKLMEHIKDPVMALKEMKRCLKPGGRIIIGTLNRQDPLNHRRVEQGEEPYASANMFSTIELRALLARHGSVRVRTSAERARESEEGAFIVAELRPWRERDCS